MWRRCRRMRAAAMNSPPKRGRMLASNAPTSSPGTRSRGDDRFRGSSRGRRFPAVALLAAVKAAQVAEPVPTHVLAHLDGVGRQAEPTPALEPGRREAGEGRSDAGRHAPVVVERQRARQIVIIVKREGRIAGHGHLGVIEAPILAHALVRTVSVRPTFCRPNPII